MHRRACRGGGATAASPSGTSLSAATALGALRAAGSRCRGPETAPRRVRCTAGNGVCIGRGRVRCESIGTAAPLEREREREKKETSRVPSAVHCGGPTGSFAHRARSESSTKGTPVGRRRSGPRRICECRACPQFDDSGGAAHIPSQKPPRSNGCRRGRHIPNLRPRHRPCGPKTTFSPVCHRGRCR